MVGQLFTGVPKKGVKLSMKADECFGAGEDPTKRFEVHHFRFTQMAKLSHVISGMRGSIVPKNLIVYLALEIKRFAKRRSQALKRVSARLSKRFHLITPKGF